MTVPVFFGPALISIRSVALAILAAWTASAALPTRAARAADLPSSPDSANSSSSRDARGPRDRLSKIHAEVRAARGPFAYVALRKLWAEWDRSDPDEIEEILREVASDPETTAPIRSYASLLEAYARSRRGDLSGARAEIDRL